MYFSIQSDSRIIVLPFLFAITMIFLFPPPAPASQPKENENLIQCENCGEVEDWLKTMAINRMEEMVDLNSQWSDDQDSLINDYDFEDDDSGACCGGTHSSDDDDDDDGGYDDDDDAADDDDDYGSTNVDEDENAHSDTNTQEADVDEDDMVKTDGEYLYLTSGGYFMIFKADPGWLTYELSRLDLTGRVDSMYIREELAVVFSTLNPDNLPADIFPFLTNDEITDVISKITIIDISDKANPEILRETWVEGTIVGTRRIDESVHVVLDGGNGVPDLKTRINSWDHNSEKSFDDAVKDLKKKNREIINDTPLENWLPRYHDRIHIEGIVSDENGLVTHCPNHYHPQEEMGPSILSILTLNLDEEFTEFFSVSIIAEGLVVYASIENLYVAGSIGGAREYWAELPEDFPTHSQIHQFDIHTDPHKAMYTATGRVKGFVLNQFSMSEYEGYLRVATTHGSEFSNAQSSVYVLKREGSELKTAGLIDGIAFTEELYAARFMGPKGYLVTFPCPEPEPDEPPEDPLFTLNLKDPNNPRLLGELEIPGFSTYIHPLDGNHLLTIGEGGNEFGPNGSVAFSIFDVSDMHAPTRIHFAEADWLGVFSPAKTDHHAFLYYKPFELLVVPLVTEQWSGVLAVDVDIEQGFTFSNMVNHTDLQGEAGAAPYVGFSTPRRSVIIEDNLFSISDLGIVITDIPTWEDLKTIDLPWQEPTIQ